MTTILSLNATIRHRVWLILAVVCVTRLLRAPLAAQGLGGAGTVQGHRQGPDWRRHAGGAGPGQQSRHRIHPRRRRPTRWVTTSSATCRRIRITSRSRREGFKKQERDVDVRSGVPITLDLTLALGGRDDGRRSRRACRGSAGTRSDGAYRHRSEPDRPTADRDLVGRAESGRHARLARRRGRLQRVLPSDRRSRADAVLDRQPAHHRPAEPPVFESDSP